MVYSSSGQVAGLLPSSIAPGTYAVTLTYNGQSSAPQNVTVVSRSYGIATANNAGTGAAQVTIGNVNGGVSLVRLTSGTLAFNNLTWTLAPAHPSDTRVIWGTGGGADALNDTGGSSGDQTKAGNFSVIVDGTVITPQYAGSSSGYPGLWQINFTLPANIAPDCFATLQISAGGQPSNNTTIAIAPPGQNSCSSAISSSTLNTLSSGGNVTMSSLVIGRLTDSQSGAFEDVGGGFNRYTAAEFLIPYLGPKFGPCNIVDETYPPAPKRRPPPTPSSMPARSARNPALPPPSRPTWSPAGKSISAPSRPSSAIRAPSRFSDAVAIHGLEGTCEETDKLLVRHCSRAFGMQDLQKSEACAEQLCRAGMCGDTDYW